jgi:hypothetical protein
MSLTINFHYSKSIMWWSKGMEEQWTKMASQSMRCSLRRRRSQTLEFRNASGFVTKMPRCPRASTKSSISFFDDTDIGESPFEQIGICLRSAEEATLVERITGLLDLMLLRLGNVGSREYMSDPMWPEVVARASVALSVFRSTPHAW